MSTSKPKKIMSPPLRSLKSRSVPMNAKSTGWRPIQRYSNTLTTGFSSSCRTSLLSTEITGFLSLWLFDLLRQPVAATNADIMHANGPAPGYPHH